MKKTIILTVLLGLSLFYVNAQDYQSFRPDCVYTYQFTQESLNFIRTDSVLEIEGGKLLYFTPNVQQIEYECYIPFGATWLGTKVFIGDDGDNLFFNEHGDTILIKTLARKGDSWMVYRDENRVIFGEITDHKMTGVLMQGDSVKTIGFRVTDHDSNPIDHPSNTQTIELSRSFGFSKILPLLKFPDFVSDNHYYDFFESSLLGISDPPSGMVNLTSKEVFDFQVGDELHTVYEVSDSNFETFYFSKTGTILRYLDRNDYPDSIVYTIERKQNYQIKKNPFDDLVITYKFDTIKSRIVLNSIYSDLKIYANEAQMDEYEFTYHIQNPWSSYGPAAKTLWANDFVNWGMEEDCYNYPIFHGCPRSVTYIKGLGGSYYGCSDFFTSYGNSLVYYKKGDQTWGTPLIITSTADYTLVSEIKIYPNPAHDRIWVSIPEALNFEVFELSDIAGKVVIRERIHQGENEISLDNCKPGMYLYRLLDNKYQVQSGKIVLQK